MCGAFEWCMRGNDDKPGWRRFGLVTDLAYLTYDQTLSTTWSEVNAPSRARFCSRSVERRLPILEREFPGDNHVCSGTDSQYSSFDEFDQVYRLLSCIHEGAFDGVAAMHDLVVGHVNIRRNPSHQADTASHLQRCSKSPVCLGLFGFLWVSELLLIYTRYTPIQGVIEAVLERSRFVPKSDA